MRYVKRVLIVMLAAVCAASATAQHKGRWVYVEATVNIYTADSIPAHYQWEPPDDCAWKWPEGMAWAGGWVYDRRGCIILKVNGKCSNDYVGDDFIALHPDCRETPPVPRPKQKRNRVDSAALRPK